MSSNTHSRNLPKQTNSWYLKTGYIHNFICKCGQADQYTHSILSNIHHPDHHCSACGNSRYLDTVMFLENKKVVRWSVFHWELEKIKTEKAWIVRTIASIPLFDYALQKIRIHKMVFATVTLHFDGAYNYNGEKPIVLKKYVYNHMEKAQEINVLMKEGLSQALYEFIQEDPVEPIIWLEKENIEDFALSKKLKIYSFFLKHDHLKELDFYSWKNFENFAEDSKEYPTVKGMLGFIFNHRQEKSLKKASFKSYTESMVKNAHYNPMADHLFAHSIEDRNFLLKLTNIDVEVKDMLFNEISIDHIKAFFTFLLERYGEKGLTALFSELKVDDFRYNNIIRDTLWLYRGEMQDFIQEHFIRVSAHFRNLHNEFIRISHLRASALHDRVAFEYHKKELEAQGDKEGLRYVLPETTNILHMWSQILHNCMYGYSRAIHLNETIIYGVFKEGELTYAVEIKRNKIVQALGTCNRYIEDEDIAKINVWFKDVYVAGWMKGEA